MKYEKNTSVVPLVTTTATCSVVDRPEADGPLLSAQSQVDHI